MLQRLILGQQCKIISDSCWRVYDNQCGKNPSRRRNIICKIAIALHDSWVELSYPAYKEIWEAIEANV